MLARGRDVVARGNSSTTSMSEARPARAKDALEEIVAEQRVVRNPAVERRLEGVDVVDALAGIGALAEQVLIDVGDGGGVRIDAAGPEKTR